MIGTTLGPYRIDRELGSGGMGTVYAATVAGRGPGLDEGTVVALKVVHPHLLETPGFFERFLREADLGRTIVHENVVRTFDCDQLMANGTLQSFLSMEYVEGQTLRELQDELELLPEELCRHVGREIARGLKAIHAAGVIHRDMKPENVLITKDHVVKVMDLGVARLTDEALRLTQTGAFVGSIHYAAPECFSGGGKHVDGRADLHALGLVLYELSCGSNPYYAESVPESLKRVLHGEPRRMGDVNPQLSPFFENVVHCLLAKLPEDRFANADELLSVLEEGEDSAWWHERARTLQAETHRPLRRIRIPRETAVYGREAELARLRDLFEKANSGDGRVVLLEGEAGIGKSRLVDELIARLQRDGEDVNFLFGSYPPNGAATASGAFSLAYREQFGEDGCARYLEETPILVPAFDALLKGELAPSGVEPLTKGSLQTCFVQSTRALAAERVTVVLIDDLHFAPEEGRALFTSLAMAVPGHRLLLIGTTRPGESENWQGGLDRFEHVSRLALPRLAAKDLAKLLEEAFHSRELAESLGYRIIVKSDGNPFFVFEIIRGLREGRFITRQDDGTWVSTGVIERIEIPSSVLDLVNAWVADLTEEERDLLDVACCWGFEFDPVLVGEVIGLARIPALKRFGQIERQHRLVRSVGRNYVFDHHQVQEALYGGLHEQLREAYHSALAEALETRTGAADQEPETLDGALCADLCEHYLMGARGESALRYLEASETHLTNRYLHAQAVALTERALAVPDLLTGPERVGALTRLCPASGPLDRLGRRARQEESAREAERLAGEVGDQERRGDAALALAWCLFQVSRLEEAGAAGRRALDIALAQGDRVAEAAAAGNLGLVFKAEGRLAEAREFHERDLTLSREFGERRGEATATGNLGLVFQAEGRLAEAREHFERCIAISHEIGFRVGEATATGNLGTVFRSEGRLPEAREHGERLLAISREIGERHGEAIATGNLGGVFMCEGRLPEAREHYERHLALSREIGNRAGETIALHNLGTVLFAQGEIANAEKHLEACRSLSEEIGFQYLTAATLLAQGAHRAAGGDGEGGRDRFVAARDLAAKAGLHGIETLARCHLASLPGGDPQDGLAAFTENQERLEAEERIEARWLLFGATGDRAHLVEARRLLDESVANVDEETRESMLTNLRRSREIMTASRSGVSNGLP